MLRAIYLSLLFTISVGLFAQTARAIDPHQLYEQNCARCHSSHARNFVELSIRVRDGQLIGRNGKQDVVALLQAGHGKLNADEIMVLKRHFVSIEKSKGLFYKKCTICHGRAVDFARKELFLKDGVLIGRYSKRNIEIFLERHGQLEGQEIQQMIDVLRRQFVTEVH